MTLVRKRRMYGGLTLAIFRAADGLGLHDGQRPQRGQLRGRLAPDARLSGGCAFGGLGKGAGNLPGLLVEFFPALIETINIAAVSTLVGALIGLVLSLLSTRGLARWPRLIPLFRRFMDILRAVPEIVIALVLIFILGGGPVPAMIAISLHTAGALGKLYSEVAGELRPQADRGARLHRGGLDAADVDRGPAPRSRRTFSATRSCASRSTSAPRRSSASSARAVSGSNCANAMSMGPRPVRLRSRDLLSCSSATIVFFDQISSRYRNKLTEGQ